MSTFAPTAEQLQAETALRARKSIEIVAVAGAGKTTTLIQLATVCGELGLYGAYSCFNGSTAKEASRRFPRNFLCSTAHGIATQASRGRDGRPYWHHRLNSRETKRGLQNAKLVAKILGITDPAFIPQESPLKPESIALLALNTVREFCKTAAPEILAAHVPCPRWMNEEAQPAVAAVVLPWARKAWEDMTARNGLADDPSATGCLNIEHDFYLKRFQLSGRPIMVPGPGGVEKVADVLFVDECQDLSPVTLAIARRMRDVHGAQLVIVGDSMQAINRFAGAVDAIGTIPDMTRVDLTKSWRFGPTIATEANKWLRLLSAPLRVVGNDAVTSTIGPIAEPDAILCRTGAGAMQAVIDEHAAGRKVHLVGKGEDMKEIAQACLDLDDPNKGWTQQKDLKGFHSWQQVVTYCEQGELGSEDLDAAVKLIEKYDAQTIIDAINQLVGARAANVTVCTAHVSKGLEWPKVRLGDDFRGPRRNQSGKVVLPERDELMLSYVAVTRAKERLDVGSLAWVNEWVPATQVTPEPAAAAALEEEPPAAAEPTPSASAAPAGKVGRGTGIEAAVAVLRARGGTGTDEELGDAVRDIVKAYLDPRPALQAVS